MNIKIIISFAIISVAFTQNTFPGLYSWTDGTSVSYSGGGYLISFQNSLRNAAMLVDAKRSLNLSIVKYPADINAQSATINGKLNNHNFGLAIRNINYGTFESRTSDNIMTGSFSANDTQIDIGYARFVYKEKVVLGLNSGIFYSQLEKTNASLIKISPTVMFRAKYFSTSFTIENYNKVLHTYTDNTSMLRPSSVFSIHRSFKKYPLEIEISTISNYYSSKRVNIISFVNKNNNNIFFRGGISTNKFNRMRGKQFISNILNDVGFGFGYEMDTLLISLDTFSYSNNHFIYAFSISSKF